jgi:diadenylate cyclase
MNEILSALPIRDSRSLLEILALAAIFYYTILFFRGTRGAAVLSGLVTFLILALFLTRALGLPILNWMLEKLFVFLPLAALIIFQPEIRRALAELGKQGIFASTVAESKMVDAIVQAMFQLAERKIGALVAVEREIGTRSIQETGTRLDGAMSAELLASIFFPNTPLHDGGVILADNQIKAAGCLFPLSQRHGLDKTLGMRHRAALGMTEETDCLVVLVSEETGRVSVAYKGHLSFDFGEERLRKLLTKVLLRGHTRKSRLRRVQKQLDLSSEGVAEQVELRPEQSQTHAG